MQIKSPNKRISHVSIYSSVFTNKSISRVNVCVYAEISHSSHLSLTQTVKPKCCEPINSCFVRVLGWLVMKKKIAAVGV